MTPPNENWQVGDLALLVRTGVIPCTCGGCNCHNGTALPPGTIGQVVGIATVGEIYPLFGLCVCPVLMLDNGRTGLVARFRKLKPLSDAEHRQARVEMRGPEVVA